MTQLEFHNNTFTPLPPPYPEFTRVQDIVDFIAERTSKPNEDIAWAARRRPRPNHPRRLSPKARKGPLRRLPVDAFAGDGHPGARRHGGRNVRVTGRRLSKPDSRVHRAVRDG